MSEWEAQLTSGWGSTTQGTPRPSSLPALLQQCFVSALVLMWSLVQACSKTYEQINLGFENVY